MSSFLSSSSSSSASVSSSSSSSAAEFWSKALSADAAGGAVDDDEKVNEEELAEALKDLGIPADDPRIMQFFSQPLSKSSDGAAAPASNGAAFALTEAPAHPFISAAAGSGAMRHVHFTVLLTSRPTEIVVNIFQNCIFVAITQLKKIGVLLSVTAAPSAALPLPLPPIAGSSSSSSSPSSVPDLELDIKYFLGKRHDPLHDLLARQLLSMVVQDAQPGNREKPLILALSFQQKAKSKGKDSEQKASADSPWSGVNFDSAVDLSLADVRLLMNTIKRYKIW